MSSYPNDPYRPAGQGLTPDPVSTDPAARERQEAVASVAGPASDVKDAGVAAGQDVLATAKAEGAQVVDEAKVQGRRLLDESVSELRTQASTVQGRLADAVEALTDELRAMASAPEANGTLTNLAHTGEQYGDRAAAWLRDNDLDQALAGVRRYAARNPWAFLAIAGGAGLLAGRLARSLRDDADPAALQGGYRASGSLESTDRVTPVAPVDAVVPVEPDETFDPNAGRPWGSA